MSSVLFWNIFINETMHLPDWAFMSMAGQLIELSSLGGAL